jgi:hypothetical protein
MTTRSTAPCDWRYASAIALTLFACKGHDTRSGASAPSVPPGPSLTEDATDEQNTIAGSVGGVPFPQVAAAFVIESPDSDATTVIYLLSKPARCLDLSFSGWDRTIARGTSILELKVLGKAAGSFLVVTAPTLSLREGSADWTRTGEPQPVEVRSTGGWITLDSLSTRGPATGTFSLELGRDRLTGTFNAAFCAGGHEP